MKAIEKIKAHIAKGETEKAINLLVDYTEESNSPRHKDAILLSGQFRQWKREITLGVQQSSGELRRIEMAIMDLVQEKVDASKQSAQDTPLATTTTSKSATANISKATAEPKKTNWGPIIAGLLGLLILVFGINTMFSDSPSYEDHNPPVENPQDGEPIPPTEEPAPPTNEPTPPTEEPTPPTEEEPIPPTEEPLPPIINGFNAKTILYDTDEGEGFFTNVEKGLWLEVNGSNPDGIQFAELAREAGCVYLIDEGRGMTIGLNLIDKKVKLKNDGDETFYDLYDIVEAQ